MPKVKPVRTLNREILVCSPVTPNKSQPATLCVETSEDSSEVPDTITTEHSVFPQDTNERDRYRTKAGKKLTPYQWAVYDFILGIPEGKVTTYKIVAEQVGGSARSAGNALKTNPFAPYIPCHRVVASNFFIGGFFGEWAGRPKQKSQASGRKQSFVGGEQIQINKKVMLLKEEGVSIDERGFVIGKAKAVWRPVKDPGPD